MAEHFDSDEVMKGCLKRRFTSSLHFKVFVWTIVAFQAKTINWMSTTLTTIEGPTLPTPDPTPSFDIGSNTDPTSNPTITRKDEQTHLVDKSHHPSPSQRTSMIANKRHHCISLFLLFGKAARSYSAATTNVLNICALE